MLVIVVCRFAYFCVFVFCKDISVQLEIYQCKTLLINHLFYPYLFFIILLEIADIHSRLHDKKPGWNSYQSGVIKRYFGADFIACLDEQSSLKGLEGLLSSGLLS